MNEKQALELIAKLLKKTKYLNDTQTALNDTQTEIIRGIWQNKKYKTMAAKMEITENYLASYAGPKIFRLIEQSLVEIKIYEKITKINLKSVILNNEQKIKTKLDLVENISLEREESETFIKAIDELKIRRVELAEGPLPIESDFYIERQPCEADCYQMITEKGGLIRIKAPNQMGKTSLIIRIMQVAKLKKYTNAYLNLQEIGTESLSDLKLFLKEFSLNVTETINNSEQLNISDKEIRKNWKEIFNPIKRCTLYFEKFLLPRLNKTLVLAIDEADCIFFEQVAKDFFAMLRGWHEKAKRPGNEIWAKLRIILSHSTEPYLHFEKNQSPFNVGLSVSLPELTFSQIIELTEKYNLLLKSDEIQKLVKTVGGHPYLIQLAIYYLATNRITFSHLLRTAPTEEGIYSSHLRRHLRNLEEEEELKAALIQILKTTTPVALNSLERFRLDGAGLVQLKGNKVVMRCPLYRQYFSENFL